MGDVGAVGEAELSVLSPLHPNSTQDDNHRHRQSDHRRRDPRTREFEFGLPLTTVAREVPPERTLEASPTRANVLAETSNPGKIQAR